MTNALHAKLAIPILVTANSVGKNVGWDSYNVVEVATTPILAMAVRIGIEMPLSLSTSMKITMKSAARAEKSV